MTADQLRKSILQRAIQGKLVPQDPNGEPASVLLEKIRTEKNRLIKEKKIKKNKNESIIFKSDDNRHYEKFDDGTVKCIEDEIPFEIPENWAWCRLENLMQLISGQDFSPEYYNDRQKGIPYITGASNMNDFNITINRWTETPKSLAVKNDLLITCKGSGVGKMAFMDIEKAHIARQIMAIRSFNLTNGKYLFYFLLFSVGSIRANMNGLIPGIDRKTILNLLIPLPPFVEQYRIVLRIKELMLLVNHYDNYSIKLEQMETEFPILLKKAILQYAICGKLVSQNANDEPAIELLKRIREEKEYLIKEKKIKRDKVDSVIFKGDDNKYYERIGDRVACVEEEIPFQIPENWEWTRLGNVSKTIHYGYTTSASKTGNCKLLRITDIQNNTVFWDTVPYCTVSDKELLVYGLNNRDILIARTGGTIGKSFIISNMEGNAVFASYLIRVVPVENINEFFIKLFLESPFYWQQLTALSMGTGQPNVNGQSLSSLLIPMPPKEEQIRIVDKLETTLKQ